MGRRVGQTGEVAVAGAADESKRGAEKEAGEVRAEVEGASESSVDGTGACGGKKLRVRVDERAEGVTKAFM